MHEWIKLTSDEIADLDKSLPVIIPVGLVEAHGPHVVPCSISTMAPRHSHNPAAAATTAAATVAMPRSAPPAKAATPTSRAPRRGERPTPIAGDLWG